MEVEVGEEEEEEALIRRYHVRGKAIFNKGGVHSFCSSLLPDAAINDMAKSN